MLYAFGSNGSAQLGVGHSEDLDAPAPIVSVEGRQTWTVKQVAAGGNHTVLLCDDGKVRVAGSNEDGRCGIANAQQLSEFRELQLPLDAAGHPLLPKKVAANWATTSILMEDGSVFVCGAGVVGSPSSSPLLPLAGLLSIGSRAIDIASGMAHTVIVLFGGEVWGWGKGRKGQLGSPAEDVATPRKIEGIKFKVVKAVCGKDFTCVFGPPGKGQVTMLGPTGIDRFRVLADAPSPLSGWKDVAASWGSIYALMSTGHIVAWGRNDHGQLPPLNLEDVEAIAAGSEHCLALTKNGKVLAWGWGEHGNCGRPIDEHGDVRSGWNEIGVAGRASAIFAGCATSFVQAEE